MIVDAPEWSEHVSPYNEVYCFTNPQPFPALTSTLTHLDCCAHCGSDESMKELVLKDYPSLESIHIGSYSFPHILSVEVSHLPQLKQFAVEDHCFMHSATIVPENACRVEDCPLLESISIGIESFPNYCMLELKGDELGCEIRNSVASSEVTLYGR